MCEAWNLAAVGLLKTKTLLKSSFTTLAPDNLTVSFHRLLSGRVNTS